VKKSLTQVQAAKLQVPQGVDIGSDNNKIQAC
jgi:hypothetical protein